MYIYWGATSLKKKELTEFQHLFKWGEKPPQLFSNNHLV